MPDKKVTVSRLSDIMVDEYYHVIGTDSSGMKIPPQIIRILEPPIRTSGFGVPTVKVEAMVKLGDTLLRYTTKFDLWSINVKEGGKGLLTGHGVHDRELVRMVHPNELRTFLGDDSYNEALQMQRDMKIIVADKWGNFK